MTRIIIIAFIITISSAAAGRAQPGITPAPGTCPDCVKAAADAAPVRNQINQRNQELQRLQQEQSANNANLNNVRQMRTDAARDGDTAAVQQHDRSIEDLQADNRANREQQFKKREEIRSLNEELERIGRDVDACNKRCGAFNRDLPTGTVVSAEPETPTAELPAGTAGVPPLRTAACGDCKESIAELEKEHAELQRRADRVNQLKQDLREFEEQRRKVRELQRKVDDCNKQCTPPERTTSFMNPRVIGGAAGGAALVALLTATADAPPVATAPVVSNQPTTSPPTTNPQPQPQPQPVDPPSTVAGVHDCLECAAIDDGGGHNLSIRLCDFAGGPWEVVVASITIRHGAPFVNIEGASFDGASGVFRGTTRGTVAGLANVGIAVDGIANAQTGRITFTYTIGTGGELPGGRPITYRITLQKRR